MVTVKLSGFDVSIFESPDFMVFGTYHRSLTVGNGNEPFFEWFFEPVHDGLPLKYTFFLPETQYIDLPFLGYNISYLQPPFVG